MEKPVINGDSFRAGIHTEFSGSLRACFEAVGYLFNLGLVNVLS